MDGRFLDRLEHIMHQPTGHIWQFEEWASNPRWRQQFLDKLGLGSDIPTGMATAGGGSSFSGTAQVPGFEELSARFRQIEPSHYWKTFLQNVVAARPALFNDAELRAIDAFLNEDDVITAAPSLPSRSRNLTTK